jgi:hypothetical protein
MQRMNKTLSPPTSSKPPRVSVPVSAEVLAIFERLAKVSNMSTGRAMAEWLADTVEAAELMASTMERARSAPKIVTAELHAMMLGMTDQTKELMDRFAKMGQTAKGESKAQPLCPGGLNPDGSLSALIPPSCNTGGKVPKNTIRHAGVKSGFPLPPATYQAYADTNGVPPKAPK